MRAGWPCSRPRPGGGRWGGEVEGDGDQLRMEVAQDFQEHGGEAVDGVRRLTPGGHERGRDGVEGAVYQGVAVDEEERSGAHSPLSSYPRGYLAAVVPQSEHGGGAGAGAQAREGPPGSRSGSRRAGRGWRWSAPAHGGHPGGARRATRRGRGPGPGRGAAAGPHGGGGGRPAPGRLLPSPPGSGFPPAVDRHRGRQRPAPGAVVLFVVPAQSMRANVQAVAGHLDGGAILVSASKGLEIGSAWRMSEVIAQEVTRAPERLKARTGSRGGSPPSPAPTWPGRSRAGRRPPRWWPARTSRQRRGCRRP